MVIENLLERLFHRKRNKELSAFDSGKTVAGITIAMPRDADDAQECRTLEEIASIDAPVMETTDAKDTEATDESFPGGLRVIGNYEYVRRLGRGGMGQVYLARDMELRDHYVVFKFLLPEIFKGKKDERRKAVEMLRKEGEASVNIQHPNIVRVIEFRKGDEQTDPCLVLDYLQGMTLDQYAKEHTLTNKEILDKIEGMLKGLEPFHNQGRIHRDLKPSNIMILQDGTPVILDFGLAARLQELESEGVIAGTLAYMSPEQLGDKPLSVRSDLYAVGLIAHELFTGRPAHIIGRDVRTTARNIIAGMMNPLKEREANGKQYPSWAHPFKRSFKTYLEWYTRRTLTQVIKHATQHDPEDRYGSVDDMVGTIIENDRKLSRKRDRWPFLAKKALPAFSLAALAMTYLLVAPRMLERAETRHRDGRSAYMLGNRLDAEQQFTAGVEQTSWWITLPYREEKRALQRELYLGLTRIALDLGDYPTARTHLQSYEAIGKEASGREQLYLKALGLQTRQELVAAIETYEKYIAGSDLRNEHDIEIGRSLMELYLNVARQSTAEATAPDKASDKPTLTATSAKEDYVRKSLGLGEKLLSTLDERMRESFPTAEIQRVRATLLVQQAWTYHLQNDVTKAKALLQEGLDIAEAQGNPLLGGIIMTTQSIMASEQGRLDDAVNLAQKAISFLNPDPNNTQRTSMGALGKAYDTLSSIELMRGNLREALKSSTHAITLFGELGNTRDQPLAHFNRANILAKLGNYQASLEDIASGATLARQHENAYMLGCLQILRGDIALYNDNAQAAIEAYGEAWTALDRRRSDPQRHYAVAEYALALVRAGRIADAAKFLNQDDHRKMPGADAYTHGLLLEAEALLANRSGDIEMKRGIAREVDSYWQAQEKAQDTGLLARVAAATAVLSHSLGDRERYSAYNDRARTMMENASSGDRILASQSLSLLSR